MKPILFNTAMVQAILDGRKTQTRRVVKLKKNMDKFSAILKTNGHARFYTSFGCGNPLIEDVKPAYTKGDTLWVRETFTVQETFYPEQDWETFKYKADTYELKGGEKWKPSIFMPKKAARLFLEVTDVRVERLQDILEEDAIAEGVERVSDYGTTGYMNYLDPDSSPSDIDAVSSFETLWQTIHPNGWEENPWVWVYEFKKVDKTKN